MCDSYTNEFRYKIFGDDKNKCQEKSKKLYKKIVFHSVCLLHHAAVNVYGLKMTIGLQNHVSWRVNLMGLYAEGYVTYWNFALQILFLVLAIIYDVLELKELHSTTFGKKISYNRDVLFSGVVAPFTLLISTCFWALYAYDRELILPKFYDTVIPPWFNHCIHTNILIVFILETMLEPRRKPIDQNMELGLLVFIYAMYTIVYYLIRILANVWLYSIFYQMNRQQMAFVQVLVLLALWVFYRAQFYFNRLFH